ncbi:scavenger receptor cysteine-rich type 1 protein M130-like [Cetorhinus maximus]
MGIFRTDIAAQNEASHETLLAISSSRNVFYQNWYHPHCNIIINPGEPWQVRLANGESVCDGRLEVSYGGFWGRVHDNEWNFNDADVVCRQLNCGSAIRITTGSLEKAPAQYGSAVSDAMEVSPSSGIVVLHKGSNYPSQATSAWVALNFFDKFNSEINPMKRRNENDRKKSNISPVSEDVELRLAAGFNNCSGRVEIFFIGTWGSVCDDSWDKHDAAVACRQLNCVDPVWTPGETVYDPANGTIWLDDVKCKGSERFLWDCQFSTMGDNDCEHKEDVNVIYSGLFTSYKSEFRSEYDDVQSFEMEWCSVSKIVNTFWQRRIPQVAMREITRQSAIAGVACWILVRITVGTVGTSLHPTLESATVETTNQKELMHVRLLGLDTPCVGELKVYYRDQWTSVCSSLWDSADGEVVCKQLGCGFYHRSTRSPISQETGSLLLDKVQCKGTEASLSECPFSTSGLQNCETGAIVGIFCKVKQNLMLEDGGSPCAGRVQASSFNAWRSICGRMWDMNDARVVCKYLGCGDAVSASDDSQFGAGDWPVLDLEVHCDGSEDNPWKCELKLLTHTNCSRGRKTAGVVCSGQKGPRLVGGNNACSGRVEILLGSTWGTVCDTYWDLQDAAVVCHQLGCGAAISARGGAFFGEGNGSIWYDINECIGNEWRLNDCPVSSWGHHQCTHKNDAGVICSGEPWQVRLANGEGVCDGRVEVYYGGLWGRVLDTQWNFNDADVVCKQLNCGSAIHLYNHWKFGKGTGPVWISNVRCNGSEPFLWNCSFRQEVKQLSIADDVGVVCSGTNHIQVRLADGGSRCAGRVELYYNGTWGTVCDDSWDLAEAHVVCNQLKCGHALNATFSGWFGPGAGPIWLHNLTCAANDSVLWECPAGPWGESDCNHKEDAGVICSEHRAVRLQGGPSPCQGRVEVFYNAIWGSVCADSFGMEDAEVVCKQLSCGSVRSVDRDLTFGRGFGQIWLDDVNCRLHDSLLWQCPSSPWGEHNCNHREDVGVICSEVNPMNIRNEDDRNKSNMRPVSEDVELRLAAGFNNCSGRIEIFFSGTWGTVCDDSWDRHDATVICRHLNCGDPVWIPRGALFDPANGTIWMDDVKCKGSERFLWDCQFSVMGVHDCEHKEDVNVICSGHPQYTVPFKQQRLSVFIIPCMLVALFVAVSIALAVELQRSFQKGWSTLQKRGHGGIKKAYETSNNR